MSHLFQLLHRRSASSSNRSATQQHSVFCRLGEFSYTVECRRFLVFIPMLHRETSQIVDKSSNRSPETWRSWKKGNNWSFRMALGWESDDEDDEMSERTSGVFRGESRRLCPLSLMTSQHRSSVGLLSNGLMGVVTRPHVFDSFSG